MHASPFKLKAGIAGAVFACALLLGGYVLFFAKDSSSLLSTQAVGPAAIPQRPSSASDIATAPTASDAATAKVIQAAIDRGVETARSRHATLSLDMAKLREAASKKELTELMLPKDAAAALKFLSTKELNDGRVFLKYDPYVIETKVAGDTLRILIPQLGASVEGVIQNVEVQGDIIRWEGSFSDLASGASRFVIAQTIKDSYAHAVYETPMGTYAMEAKDGAGWIMNQAAGFHLPADGRDMLHPSAGSDGHTHK